MATAIRVPDLGTTADQMMLVKWLKAAGEPVQRGDALCEVQTDKAISELESVAEGILLKQILPEETEVTKGTIVAYIGADGEELPDETTEPSAVPTASEATGPAAGPAPSSAPKVSPLLRNLAKKEGVDLAAVTGTGPGGRVTRDDILAAQSSKATSPEQGAALSANQSVVAKRVARSQREIPPIDMSMRIDMTRLLARRAAVKEESGKKLSFDAFFVHATAAAMREFPHFQSRLESDRVLASDTVNVGVAIGVGLDLYTPVISDAGGLAPAELDAAIKALQAKAESGRFVPEDLAGASLTVSNLGMYPVRAFSAVIPPDQVAILSVGATEQTPLVRDGAIAIVPMVTVTLSVDHRLINGREAAEFLVAVKRNLEEQ